MAVRLICVLLEQPQFRSNPAKKAAALHMPEVLAAVQPEYAVELGGQVAHLLFPQLMLHVRHDAVAAAGIVKVGMPVLEAMLA